MTNLLPQFWKHEQRLRAWLPESFAYVPAKSRNGYVAVDHWAIDGSLDGTRIRPSIPYDAALNLLCYAAWCALEDEKWRFVFKDGWWLCVKQTGPESLHSLKYESPDRPSALLAALDATARKEPPK